ncbi:MAG: fumarylacetoacetate hydrolase family protein [Armatimonadota bacterium]
MKLVRYKANLTDEQLDDIFVDEFNLDDDAFDSEEDEQFFKQMFKDEVGNVNTPRLGILFEEDKGVFDIQKAFDIYAAVNSSEPLCIKSLIDAINIDNFYDLTLEELVDFIEDHSLSAVVMSDLDDVKFLPPIERPSAIYALGRNFPDHAKESGVDVPKEPVYFFKSPNCLIAHEDNVIWKDGITRIDPEAELAVVIGHVCNDIEESFALDVVAGYTIMNDVTARDMQTEDLKVAHPWFRSKNLDTFCPMGPYLVTADEIGYPINLDIEMRVNGEVRQKDNTKNMTFNVPQVISYLSRYHTLYPGDIISMGTPEGMKPVEIGDTMEAYVEKIGILRNGVQRKI